MGSGAALMVLTVQVDVTWLGYFMAAVSLYYVALFVLSLRALERRPPDRTGPQPAFALIVPAHNEELVLAATLESLVRLDYEAFCVLVVDDGSTDATLERARAFESSGVVVVHRPPEVAGRGKGAVLNEGYRILEELRQRRDPRLRALQGRDLIVGVVDADGHLEQNALREVARYFADPEVGGVQVGVIIGNAEDGLVPRCQDLEFVGFSHLAQAARDRMGSVGLGGNGQFTRMDALRSLGRPPWTDCLTEDLDLGLNLTRLGWKMRFCRSVSVTQQGVRGVRAWLRQRTRWAQGHYQCWDHVPRLLSAGNVPLVTRLDLVLYLLFVAFVMFVAANLTIAIAGALGWVVIVNDFLGFLPPGPPRNVTMEIIGLSPVVMLLTRYQQQSPHRLRWWELPAYGAAFAVYVYLWTAASMLAWWRLVRGRAAWSKTRRVHHGAPS